MVSSSRGRNSRLSISTDASWCLHISTLRSNDNSWLCRNAFKASPTRRLCSLLRLPYWPFIHDCPLPLSLRLLGQQIKRLHGIEVSRINPVPLAAHPVVGGAELALFDEPADCPLAHLDCPRSGEANRCPSRTINSAQSMRPAIASSSCALFVLPV
jgi:hypothetical protein